MKKSIIKLVSFMLSFVILILTLTSCDFLLLNDTGVQNGFIHYSGQKGTSEESNPNICAFKSDKSIFNIDDVTLTFGFGWYCVGDPETESAYPWQMEINGFDLCFENETKLFSIIKHIDDRFISPKYAVTQKYIMSEDNTTRIGNEKTFTHTETITIPAKFFNRSNGCISFYLAGIDENTEEKEYIAFAGVNIYYKKLGNKVRLYDSWSEWYYGESEK